MSATTNWAVINLQSPAEQRATVRPKFDLDYETQTVWNVTVIAVDGRKANNTGIIHVEVIDVNEPPTIQDITLGEVSENTPTRYITYCDVNGTNCKTNVTKAKLVDFSQYQYSDPEDGNLTVYDANKMQGITFGFKDDTTNSVTSYYPPNGGKYFYIDSITGTVYLNNNVDYEDSNKNSFT